MQKPSRALLSNLHVILAAVIGVLGVLAGSYLTSTYSSDNTARDWKRLAYSSVVSEAMYLAPQNLLLPTITDKASCEAALQEMFSTHLFSESEKREGINKIEKAFGAAILLAETPLRKKLIEFRKTINATLHWGSVSFFQLKGLKQQNDNKEGVFSWEGVPAMTKTKFDLLCSDKHLRLLAERYVLQEELLRLMRSEMGLR